MVASIGHDDNVSGELSWGEPYPRYELTRVQAKWDIVFPPDLVSLLLKRRPISRRSRLAIDWTHDEDASIKDRLEWPINAFITSVERNDLWYDSWGPRSTNNKERKSALRNALHRAPKLIPLYANKYIPSAPSETGNPVFSVMGSDIVHYGANLSDYFERQAHGWACKPWPDKIRYIPFWTEVTDLSQS